MGDLRLIQFEDCLGQVGILNIADLGFEVQFERGAIGCGVGDLVLRGAVGGGLALEIGGSRGERVESRGDACRIVGQQRRAEGDQRGKDVVGASRRIEDLLGRFGDEKRGSVGVLHLSCGCRTSLVVANGAVLSEID